MNNLKFMQSGTFLLLICLLVSACAGGVKKSGEKESSTQALADYYRNPSADSIYYVRLLQKKSHIELIEGVIFYSSRNVVRQQIREVKKLEAAKVNAVANALEADGYRKTFDALRQVMLIQLAPVAGKYMSANHMRVEIENILDAEFMKKGCAQWISGDVGSGGINMLFFVNNWELALETAIAIIEQENLSGGAIIAKRLSFSEFSWNYQILFPLEFDGVLDVR